ncbi:hypothetical protein ACHWQZ_G014474 [Mnemiopsis leidyi]
MSNLLFAILLVCGCVVDVEGAEYSCLEAKEKLDSCITRGYEVRHLKHCLVHPVNTVPKTDKSCKRAERVLHKDCGYRECSG